MSRRINIGIIDDHHVFREGIVSLFQGYDSIEVIFDLADGTTLAKQLSSTPIDILILDLEMSEVSGEDLLREIKRDFPAIKIMILTAFYDIRDLPRYLKKGISAYLPKHYRFEKIVKAIETVHKKGSYFDRSIVNIPKRELLETYQETAPPAIEKSLTEEEITIVKYLCQNKTARQIADLINRKTDHVEYTKKKINRKTGCKTIAELIQYAIKKRWLVL